MTDNTGRLTHLPNCTFANMVPLLPGIRCPDCKLCLPSEAMLTRINQWDEWYARLPSDLSARLSLHDFKRLGDLFKDVFKIE